MTCLDPARTKARAPASPPAGGLQDVTDPSAALDVQSWYDLSPLGGTNRVRPCDGT